MNFENLKKRIFEIYIQNTSLSASIMVSTLLASALALVGFVTSDATQHMFFAEHYAESWFSLFESQIGGGIDMTTYPPLAYQLTALADFIFPVETAFWMITIASWTGLSLFATKLFSDYLSLPKEREWIVYLTVFFNIGVLKTVLVHGQMTTMVGLMFGFSMIYFLNRALETRENLYFALFGLSYALVAFTHHFSFILVSMLWPFLAVFKRDQLMDKEVLYRFVPSLGATGIITFMGILPFVLDLVLGNTIPGQPIPHFTRQSVFAMPMKQVESTIYLVYGIPGALLALPLVRRNLGVEGTGRYMQLYITAFFFFLMGLGPTTPLPRLLLMDLANWLTYDRFALMSSILFSGLFGALIPRVVEKKELIERYGSSVLPVLVMLFIAVNVALVFRAHDLAHGDPVNTPNEYRDEMRQDILEFLESSEGTYRYQTFGYGVPVSEIYLRTEKPTLDSWYFSGRSIEWLVNSGETSIDGGSREFVETFMSHADNYSVKYIFTMDHLYRPPYHEIIESYNWTKLEVNEYGDRKLVVWENPGTVEPVKNSVEEKTFVNYLWGLVPPAVFFTWMSAFLYAAGIKE